MKVNIIENILKIMYNDDNYSILKYIFHELKKLLGDIDGIIYEKNNYYKVMYSNNDNLLDININKIKNLITDKIIRETKLFNNKKYDYYMIIPLIHNNLLVGVIILASIDNFPDIQDDFINELSSVTALTIKNKTRKEIYKYVLNSIDVPVILWKRTDQTLKFMENLKCIFVNKAAYETMNNKVDMYHKKFGELFPYITKYQEIFEKYVNLLKTNEEQILDYSYTDDNIIEDKLKIFHISNNIYCCIRLSLEELYDSKNKLKKRTNFMINMSHEIRTPLNGIMGMITLLHDTNLSSIQNEYLEIMKDSSLRLMATITDILDISRLDMKKIKLKKKKLNIEKCIILSHNIIKSKADKKNIFINYNIDKNIPKYVYGDYERLQQIIINLLYNAIKFTNEGKIITTVKIKELNQDIYNILFEIKDTGIGIEKENLSKIFDAFTQVDQTNTKIYQGSGIGLSISKHLCKLMGGNISVDSQIGKGSTFKFNILCEKYYKFYNINNKNIKILIVHTNANIRISLYKILLGININPIIVSSITEANMYCYNSNYKFDLIIMEYKLKLYCKYKKIKIKENYDEKKLINKINDILSKKTINKNIKILLAEDIDLNIKVATALLNKLGYTNIDCAKDGIETLDKVKNNNYDVVLLDIKMPKLDGIEVFKIMKSNYKNIPYTVALTANALDDDEHHYVYDLGMNNYISKPIDINKLKSVLEMV